LHSGYREFLLFNDCTESRENENEWCAYHTVYTVGQGTVRQNRIDGASSITEKNAEKFFSSWLPAGGSWRSHCIDRRAMY